MEDVMELRFRPLSRADAEAIATWRYPGRYAVYDAPDDEFESSVRYMIDPANGFYGAFEDAELVGFCSLGPDGRVPGGPYGDAAVDVGAGLRPDLTGGGRGAAFLREAVTFLESVAGGQALRATVASWNERALRAAGGAGFEPRSTFTGPRDTEYTILVLDRP